MEKELKEFQESCVLQHKTIDTKLNDIISKLDTLNYITIHNGGGRHITFQRDEFVQMAYDKGQELDEVRETIDSIKDCMDEQQRQKANKRNMLTKGWKVFYGFIGFVFLILQIFLAIKTM